MQKNLPHWDLSDLYSGIEDEKIKKDMEEYKKCSLDLEKKYKGKLKDISASEMLDAVLLCEKMTIKAHFVSGFAYLNMCTQMENEKATIFFQNIRESLIEYGKPSIFFSLELNQLSDAKIEEFLKNKELAKFKTWFDSIRMYKKYELSEEIETLLADKSITSSSAWVRLYNEHSAKLKYIVDGKEYNDAEISSLTQDTNAEIRHKAGREMNRVSKENDAIFNFIYNMIIKDKAISNEKRGFAKPISSRNLANNVEDEVVLTLVKSVRDSYKNIAHRFYKLKAKWLGVEKISYWDRNAPLPFAKTEKISWEDSVKLVLESYHDFSPELHKMALNFFENNWIDVAPKKGKRSGAFAHPVSSKAHPYLFLNFTGEQRDVLTLSHELGHGCHMMLSGKQGELQDDTPLTLAEVASVFGESLTFQKLLSEVKDDNVKLCLIASKVNSMINTALRQIAFHFFEERAHEERKQGEISSARFVEIWQEEMRASLGDYVEVGEDSEYIWSQISHFFHAPFYVYAYSFADCIVNSLFSIYKEGKVENFEGKYLNLLSETGIKKYDELLSPFGLDAKDKDFWNKGLNVISEYLDELESLDNKLFR